MQSALFGIVFLEASGIANSAFCEFVMDHLARSDCVQALAVTQSRIYLRVQSQLFEQ